MSMSLALDAMVFCEISSISFWVAMVFWWISLWGLPEESSLLDTEVNRFSLTLTVWTKVSETTLLQ